MSAAGICRSEALRDSSLLETVAIRVPKPSAALLPKHWQCFQSLQRLRLGNVEQDRTGFCLNSLDFGFYMVPPSQDYYKWSDRWKGSAWAYAQASNQLHAFVSRYTRPQEQKQPHQKQLPRLWLIDNSDHWEVRNKRSNRLLLLVLRKTQKRK